MTQTTLFKESEEMVRCVWCPGLPPMTRLQLKKHMLRYKMPGSKITKFDHKYGIRRENGG